MSEKDDWKLIQTWAGVTADGVPGPATASAIIANAGITRPAVPSEISVSDLQYRIGVPADGQFGPASYAALKAKFTNTNAPAVTEMDIAGFANRIGCTTKQMRAVAKVESAGGGFDNSGRPKILYERHIFHRLTSGSYSTTAYSNPSGGGYNESSWDKLGAACTKDPDAAFASCSWGKFQVMGMHWEKLGYADSYELAYSTVLTESAHYELLVRYVLYFGLAEEMRAISANPDDCRPFAKGYNGSGYEAGGYHTKLAEAMR